MSITGKTASHEMATIRTAVPKTPPLDPHGWYTKPESTIYKRNKKFWGPEDNWQKYLALRNPLIARQNRRALKEKNEVVAVEDLTSRITKFVFVRVAPDGRQAVEGDQAPLCLRYGYITCLKISLRSSPSSSYELSRH